MAATHKVMRKTVSIRRLSAGDVEPRPALAHT